jgi:hypothetical protein
LDLWLTLLVLCGVQCMIRLSQSEVLFVRPFRHWRAVDGSGWRLTHPFDGGAAAVAVRLGLVMDGDRLYARERAVRFGLSARSEVSVRDRGLPFSAAEPSGVEHSGHLVRVDGRLFRRCATRGAAAASARLLQDLAGASPQEAKARIRVELDNALSMDEYERQREDSSAATRTLAWFTRVYLPLLVAGLPLAMLSFGEELGLMLSFPVLVLAHLGTLVTMWRAHCELFPTQRDQRFEDVLTAALYPPALLRAHANMQLEVLSAFHPAVHAASRLEGERRQTFLRSELARLDLAAEQPDPSTIASLERESLIEFLKACGESRESLFRVAPESGKPSGSYCPVCSAEYLRDSGHCGDCGAALIAY